jgi:lysophospholipase L1-like esterase
MTNRSALKKISLSLLGCAFALILLEAAARIFLPAPQRVKIESASTAATTAASTEPLALTYARGAVGEFDSPLYMHTPTGRRLRPNTVAMIEHERTCSCKVEVRTNSLGYRGPEIGPKGDKPRVLVLGDSITLGAYLDENQTWVRQLEQLTQSSEPIETINAGVAASGVADQLAILLETGLSTRPDVVLIGIYLNDVQVTPGVSLLRLPPLLEHSRLLYYLGQHWMGLLSPEVEKDYGGIRTETMLSWAERTLQEHPIEGELDPERKDLARKIQTFFADWGSGFSEGAWQHMRPFYAEFARLARVHNFRLGFVMFPVADQVYWKRVYDGPQQMMAQIAAELGVPFLDLLPSLRAQYQSGNTQLFYDWCHLKPAANSLVAEQIVPFLQERLLR